MSITLDDAIALDQLEQRLKAILPALYGESYEDVQPVSMGSAPLRYDVDGRVAWNEIWGSFCDLAMAGGPPHRGTLLQPASGEEINAASHQYARVVQEVCRGIALVTGLKTQPSTQPGWVEIQCNSATMAAWLVRAIVMENVMARHQDETLLLPAGPEFRLNKEIKNVITSIAKTRHYWLQHTPVEQQRSIEEIFDSISPEETLMEPAIDAEVAAERDAYLRVLNTISEGIEASLKLPCFRGRYAGWVGVECESVRKAVWVMRALISENILARREGEVVFLPVNPRFEALGQTERLIQTFSRLYQLSIVARV